MTVRPMPSSSIPLPALLLGWAGVIPFAGLALAHAAGLELPIAPGRALAGYGAIILSFMGGCQWGIAAKEAPIGFGGSPVGYAVSVLPALLAWVGLAFPNPFPILIAGFLALLLYDLWTVRRGIAPGWYGRLRIQLTVAAVASLGIAALA